MRYCVAQIILFVCLSANIFAQSKIDLTQLDTIIVQVDDEARAFYTHNVKPSETLYSIARFFGIHANDLLILNNIAPDSIIPAGAIVNIPINTEYLIREARQPSENCIPVIYHVKKRETLFKISQVYFNQGIESLIIRNEVKKLSLRPDQALVVGWWPISQPQSNQELPTIEQEILNVKSKNFEILTHDHPTQLESIHTSGITYDSLRLIEKRPSFVISNKNGIAIWERSDQNTESLLVLHKTAQTGSMIKLLNPVTERSIVATVVGQIPSNVYTEDVDLIVSRAVAQKLGALDTRFQVQMTYYD